MSYESEVTRLKREINSKSEEEYQQFKDDRQEYWQDFSPRSSFFGVSYIVLFPLISFIMPFDIFKTSSFFIFCIIFIAVVVFIEKKFGSIRAFIGRMGLVFTKYKLNRVRRFFGIRFY